MYISPSSVDRSRTVASFISITLEDLQMYLPVSLILIPLMRSEAFTSQIKGLQVESSVEGEAGNARRGWYMSNFVRRLGMSVCVCLYVCVGVYV